MIVNNINVEKDLSDRTSLWYKMKSLRELNLLLIVLAVGIILAFTSQFFFTWNNIKVVLSSFATDGIVVIGMTLMLIIGGIDLSVGSVLCLSMTICSLLFLGGMNPWLAALVAVAACVIIGLIMGLIVTRLGLSYFIVTLAFMGIARGLVLILSGGTPVSIVAELDAQTLFKSLGQGQFLGIIPMQVVIFLVIALVSDYIVRSSSAMRLVFYTGSNEKAAEYSGINTNKVKILVGMVCSGLCGVAGIIYLTKFSGVPMSAGSGLEMTAISSAVIGGASLTGGRGTVAGSILGLALMAFVTNAMTLFTVPPFWQDFIKYSILLIAVVLDQLQQKAKLRRT